MTRRSEWLVLTIAALIAWPVWSYRGERHHSGDIVDAAITLITADRNQLSCASRRAFGTYRCETRAPGRAWPNPPAAAEQLAPYNTTDGQFFLVPGLFEQPALAARYAQEPPEHVAIKRLHRFVARCKLRLVRAVRRVQVRWLRKARWGDGPQGWVAEPVTCQVSDD